MKNAAFLDGVLFQKNEQIAIGFARMDGNGQPQGVREVDLTGKPRFLFLVVTRVLEPMIIEANLPDSHDFLGFREARDLFQSLFRNPF